VVAQLANTTLWIYLQVILPTATPAQVLEAIQQKLEANSIALPLLQWITDNDIDGEVFQTLQSTTLIELGVASLGVQVHILSLQGRVSNTPVSPPAMRQMLTVWLISCKPCNTVILCLCQPYSGLLDFRHKARA
jgi:hypothetical protein